MDSSSRLSEKARKFENEILLKYESCKSVFKAKKNINRIKGSTYSWYKSLGKA